MNVAGQKHELFSLRGFALWAWATLLVVVLSAVPTEAEPRSRSVGSAFDPATYSVALSQKRHVQVKAVSADEVRDPRLHASDRRGDLLLLDTLSGRSVLSPVGIAPPITSFVVSLNPTFTAHNPRAPPVQ